MKINIVYDFTQIYNFVDFSYITQMYHYILIISIRIFKKNFKLFIYI